MTSSKILFFLCVAFVLGIFIESIIKIPQIFLWVFLSSVVSFIFICLFLSSQEHWNRLLVFGFFGLMIILGILRVQITEFNVASDKLSKLNDSGKIYALVGIINNEPDVRDTFQKLKVKINKSTVLITTNRYPEYKYLDKIKLTGKLETPSVTPARIATQSVAGGDEFNYKNYLIKDGIYSVMNFPKIEPTGHDNCSFYRCPTPIIYSGILWVKQKIRESIQNNFSPPGSSILKGTILGDNGAMTQDLKNKLNITGLRHIIAVSGTHVVILSAIIISFLMFLGFYRGQAFYIVTIFIFLYIVLTGFPASGIRAGIMGGIFLLSEKLGRQNATLRIIALAGAIMLALNPLLLLYDVGFQLSFMAVLGLIYLEPPIKNIFKIIIKKIFKIAPKGKSENLLTVVSATLSAQIFTLPILVYNFGNISYVSLITNILISPIVSLLMIFGFLSSVAGVFSNMLGWIFSMPCYFLLLYFVWIINFFSQPWAMKVIQNVSWIWLVISYFIIGLFAWFLNKKYKQNFIV